MNWNTTIFERSIELDKPTTGVCYLVNCPEWIFDDISSGIDLDYENGLESGCLSPDDLEYWDSSNSTILFGGWTKVDGLYQPDRSKDYSAIYNANYGTIQVVWSNTVKRFARPTFQGCYPGQVDLESGESETGYLAFCLPGDESE